MGAAALRADDGRAFACMGAYFGTGGRAFPDGTDDLTCAMSLCQLLRVYDVVVMLMYGQLFSVQA